MVLQMTSKGLASAPIGAIIPAEAAGKAASAGSPFLLEQFIAVALKRRAFKAVRDEAKAEKIVKNLLGRVSLTVEFI